MVQNNYVKCVPTVPINFNKDQVLRTLHQQSILELSVLQYDWNTWTEHTDQLSCYLMMGDMTYSVRESLFKYDLSSVNSEGRLCSLGILGIF